MKQKIIHIPRRFVKEKWGGTETVILELSRRLVGRGYDAEIHTSLALSDKKEEMVYGLPVKRYPYFYTYLGLSKDRKRLLDSRGGNLFSFSLFFSLLFLKGVKLFHLHTMGRMGGIVRTVSKLRKIPYIVSIHGGFLDMPEKMSDELLAPSRGLIDYGKILGLIFGSRYVLKDADTIICLNRKEEELLRQRFPGKKIERLPNGVDAGKFRSSGRGSARRQLGIAEGEKLLLCVSRIDFQKNQLLLIDAFETLAQKLKNLKLVLAGPVADESYYTKVKKKIDSLSAAKGKIAILTDIGFGSDRLADLYAASDIFILPSLHEPFGIVILEAWAAKKPVVASKTGGIAEIIEDGRNGLLFDSGSEESLEDAVTRILDNENLSASLTANASEKLKEYSWDNIAERLIGLYNAL